MSAEQRARVEKYGEGWTIWVEPAPVRLVEMTCCGFTYSADHEDVDGNYTCPLCCPSADQQVGGLRDKLERIRRICADSVNRVVYEYPSELAEDVLDIIGSDDFSDSTALSDSVPVERGEGKQDD